VRRRRGTRPRRAHAALPSRYDHCYPLFFLKKSGVSVTVLDLSTICKLQSECAVRI
jgi:hypothetical protein